MDCWPWGEVGNARESGDIHHTSYSFSFSARVALAQAVLTEVLGFHDVHLLADLQLSHR